MCITVTGLIMKPCKLGCPPLEGTPEVFSKGQGGLLDLALDPEFAISQLVYLSFAEPGEGGASTALGRGRLQDGGWTTSK